MKEQLARFMEQKGLTQTQVAKALGKSVAVINQYLKGTYKGVNKDIDEAVDRLIKRQNDKVVERHFNGEFVPTSVAESCLDIIASAHIEHKTGLLYGASGLGKTMAIKQYVSQNPEVLLIEVDPSYSPKVLLSVLCQKLGVNEVGLNHELFERVLSRLSEDRLIIVDEAELLNTRSLEFLRRIKDKSGCGLVLVGMPRLLVNLKGKYGELAQLYGRIGLAWNLGNALPEEDIALLAEKGLGTNEFNDLLFKESKGNARRLNNLMTGAIRIAELNDRKVDELVIKRYAQMLIG